MDDYPLLKEHISSISLFEEPAKRAERKKRKIEDIDVRISELEEKVADLEQKKADFPNHSELYSRIIKTRLRAIDVQKLIKKRWSHLFDFEVFLRNWYLSKLTANQPSTILKRFPRIIEAQ